MPVEFLDKGNEILILAVDIQAQISHHRIAVFPQLFALQTGQRQAITFLRGQPFFG